MKVKTSKRKEGKTRIDYYNVPDIHAFRFKLLKIMLDDYSDAALFIDTNQRVNQKSRETILEDLRDAGVEPLAIRIPENKEKIFGFELGLINKHNTTEYMIIIQLNGHSFKKEVFAPISGCDIAIGVNQKEPLKNHLQTYSTDPLQLLTTCFENVIYDSIFCARVNSDLDISGYVGEVVHEMGL